MNKVTIVSHYDVGIRMIFEFRSSHCLERFTALDTIFGDTDHHLAALAQAGGLL